VVCRPPQQQVEASKALDLGFPWITNLTLILSGMMARFGIPWKATSVLFVHSIHRIARSILEACKSFSA
jgi:hypothetical protein